MGIPLETGSNDVFFDDEIGYRIPKDSYALPEITFDSDELAALGVAARMWQHAALSGAAAQAVRKLEGAGVDVDRESLSVIEPRVDAAEPAFAPLWRAVQERRQVTFGYSRSGGEPTQRNLQPWGLVSWHGRWYLVGHDLDRGDTRVFRLSRIHGEVGSKGGAGAYDVPSDTDVTASVRMLAKPAPAQTARLRVRDGRAAPLRRRARTVAQSDGWTTVQVEFDDVEQLAASVAGFGSAVVAEAPDELRDAVVRRLRGAAESVA
jgi:proteasome accessory factor B